MASGLFAVILFSEIEARRVARDVSLQTGEAPEAVTGESEYTEDIGSHGTDGPDGIVGTDGSDGPDGPNTSTGDYSENTEIPSGGHKLGLEIPKPIQKGIDVVGDVVGKILSRH